MIQFKEPYFILETKDLSYIIKILPTGHLEHLHFGAKILENDLEQLKTVKRREIAERIKVAREFGDISENAEYDEAKNEQAFTEGKIAEIEHKLKIAKVIDDDDITTDTVSIGAAVKVKDLEYDEECKFVIVGSSEADPLKDLILSLIHI